MTYTLANPLTAQNFIDLLNTIIDGLIRLAIPITVIIIIWAGVLYIISAGSDRTKTATKALTYAVLGFGIILISSGIIAIIQDFLGAGQKCSGPFGEQDGCPTGYICSNPSGGTTGICEIAGEGPSTFEELLQVFTDISGWLFAFALVAGVAMIIVSGLAYIFARGDATRAGRALQILFYSIIGVAVAALAWSIINIVANFLTGKQIFGSSPSPDSGEIRYSCIDSGGTALVGTPFPPGTTQEECQESCRLTSPDLRCVVCWPDPDLFPDDGSPTPPELLCPP